MLNNMQALWLLSNGKFIIFHNIAHDKQYCTNMFIMRKELLLS